MNPITLFLVIASALVGLALGKIVDIYLAPPFLVAAVIIALSLKMANAWQKFVILRAGKFQGVKGPGLFLIFPIIDNVTAVIDERIQTTAFNAEQALTKDTVPVNVDANGNTLFAHVEEAMTFPVPTPTALLDDYIVYVGFDPVAAEAQTKPPPKARPKPKGKPAAGAH